MAKSVQKLGGLRLEEASRIFRQEYDDLVDIIAEESLNHFLEGFQKGAQKGGGQTDDSRGGWKPRKRETKLSKKKSILNSSGNLFDDIDVQIASRDRIEIGTKRIPYARTHNEGLRVPERRPKRRKVLKFEIDGKTVYAKKAASFKMPKREFLGKSKKLDLKNRKLVNNFLNMVFKGTKVKV